MNIKRLKSAEHGLIDMNAAVIGIFISLLMAAVISLGAFAILPWQQDTSAKSSLQSIQVVQASVHAPTGKYLNHQKLNERKLIPRDLSVPGAKLTIKALDQPYDPGAAATNDVGAGSHYVAILESESGQRFYVSDQIKSPAPLLN